MLRMIRQSRIKDFFHLFVPIQEFCDLASTAVVLLHAHSERLYSAQHQPAFKWGKNSPGALLHEGKCLLVLRLGADDHAAKAVAMAVEKLRGRMHHDVGAQRNR